MAKAKVPDPLSEIAANVVAMLENHRRGRQNNTPSFLTWSQVVAGLSGVNPDWVLASLGKSPAKGNVIVAVPDDLKSPVALAADVEKLVQDGAVLQRLIQHLSFGCSEANPVRGLTELCRGADKSLKGLLEKYWSEHLDHLPQGLTAIRKTTGRKTTAFIHDERFARHDVILSQRLVAALEALQSAGETRYPASLSELLVKAHVDADDELLPEAMAVTPFAETVCVIGGKLPEAWLAFRSDAQSAVNSEGYLKRLLTQLCSIEEPEAKLSAIAKLLAPDLQSRFCEVWRTHGDLQRRFSFVELCPAGTKAKPDLIFRDARFPRPEKVLSEQLVRALETRRSTGGSTYPLSWCQLSELAKTSVDSPLLQKAVVMEPFVSQAITALPTAADSPVALTEDAALLAVSPALLEAVMSQLVTDDSPAISMEKLALVKSMHLVVRPLFVDAVNQFISDKQMPAGFGALLISGKWHVFRTKDILLPEPAAPADDTKTKRRQTTGTARTSGTKSAGSPASSTSENALAGVDVATPDEAISIGSTPEGSAADRVLQGESATAESINDAVAEAEAAEATAIPVSAPLPGENVQESAQEHPAPAESETEIPR